MARRLELAGYTLGSVELHLGEEAERPWTRLCADPRSVLLSKGEKKKGIDWILVKESARRRATCSEGDGTNAGKGQKRQQPGRILLLPLKGRRKRP